MRAMKILASVAAVVALGGIMTAQAVASPEFDGEKYPYKLEGKQLNIQGFGDSLGAIAANCEKATASTEVEGLANPTKSVKELKAHPIYGVTGPPTTCYLTLLGTTSGETKVNSEGCQYNFHAVAPNSLTGTTDVQCGVQQTAPTAGNCKVSTTLGAKCEVKIEAGAGLPTGCVVSVPAQVGLKNVEYKNEPAGKVKLGAEVAGIETLITSSCVVGKASTKSEYREGELEEITQGELKTKKGKLAPKGKPAFFETEAKSGTEADPIEVGINEPHWYEDHVALAAQSGLPGAEGNDAVIWGKVTLSGNNASGLGTSICQTVAGGDVYNTGGAGPGAPFGNAPPGKVSIDALDFYDCEEPGALENCVNGKEVGGKRLTVTAEGLNGPAGEEWEAIMQGPPVKMKINGIKLNAVCQGGTYNDKLAGEQVAEFEPGLGIGSSPAKVLMTASPALTATGTVAETVTLGNKVKMMGPEGDIFSTKNP